MNFTALTAILLFAVASVLLMLHVKTDVQSLYGQRQELVREQILLKELQKVQKAELAHLLNPSRLQKVADEMGLEPVSLNQLMPIKPEALLGEGYGQ